jgi:hypothetical protein
VSRMSTAERIATMRRIAASWELLGDLDLAKKWNERADELEATS